MYVDKNYIYNNTTYFSIVFIINNLLLMYQIQNINKYYFNL